MKSLESNDELFSRVCDGIASADEIGNLHRQLRTEQDSLDAWLHYTALHGDLVSGKVMATIEHEAGLRLLPSRTMTEVATSPVRRNWSQWRPLTSAAAGVVFGLFTATMVWAYVSPFSGRTISLLEEGFDTVSPPLSTRMPLEPGIWRGDKAEIVSQQQGISPPTGQNMLRFLRDDSDGKPRSSGAHIADVYRLIDLREYRHELADGGAVVQASVRVNAKEFSVEERYGCAISIYALDAESLPESATRLGNALTSEANAMARCIRTKLDRDAATWQHLSTELRLPENTEFLVIRLHISQLFDSDDKTVFTGSYADDVRVTLTRRAPTL